MSVETSPWLLMSAGLSRCVGAWESNVQSQTAQKHSSNCTRAISLTAAFGSYSFGGLSWEAESVSQYLQYTATIRLSLASPPTEYLGGERCHVL